MSIRRRAFATVALLATFAAPPAALSQSGELIVRVGVVGTDEPIYGATVSLKSLRARAITDSAGVAHFRGVPVGTDSVSARLIGYEQATVAVEIRPDVTIELLVSLTPIPEQLKGVLVATSRPPREPGPGFDRRKDLGVGRFITRDEIEKQDPTRTSDIFRRVPGVLLTPIRGGHMRVVMSRGSTRCRTQFYVDNVPMTTEELLDEAIQERVAIDMASAGGSSEAQGKARARAQSRMLNRDVPSFTVDQIQPDDVEAIEIYKGASEIPPEYNRTGAAMCGVVVIWTRRPSVSSTQ